jgi:hypothetical protein
MFNNPGSMSMFQPQRVVLQWVRCVGKKSVNVQNRANACNQQVPKRKKLEKEVEQPFVGNASHWRWIDDDWNDGGKRSAHFQVLRV